LTLTANLELSNIVVGLLVEAGVVVLPRPGPERSRPLSLTPGELLAEMAEQGVMYPHCLGATEARDDIGRAQKMRRDSLGKIIK
jgi:hypothetical protein